MSLPSGTKLGGYEVLAQIGAGGMGEVYRARDTRLERVVALKVLPDHLSQDPESLARFEREAKAVAALSHPNILAVFDFGKHGQVAFVAMELLEGESLRARLESGPLGPRKALEYGLQICLGLAAAHDKGIVHRDLKPENLFLTRDGRVKILDFGLAKVKPQAPHERDTLDLTPMTEPGTVMGDRKSVV
jgi:serine/threonine protein kinase